METITYGQARRPARVGVGALAHDRRRPASVEADAERELEHAPRPLRGRAAVADPRRARARRCTRTSASSAARSRWSSQGEIVRGLRERYEHVVVEDKGDVFNSDLTQALELGYLLDLAECMVVSRARAQGEPRRARAAVRLPRPRRRELPAAHRRDAGRMSAPKLDWKPVTMTKWQPEERTY